MMQHLGHRTSCDVRPLLRQSTVGEIATGVLAVGHIHIADDIHDAAVGLFGQTLILTSVSGFHVEDGDVQALRTNHRQTRVGVAQYQYSIGLRLHHHLIALVDDVAHGLSEVITHSLHIDVGIGEFQVLEEYAIQVVVIVLPSMCQQAVEILPALIDYCGQADNLWSRTNDDKQLQLTVIFELCHIVYFTGSKNVSGLFGSKTSLQYMTVTRSSVSERLMMLWV